MTSPQLSVAVLFAFAVVSAWAVDWVPIVDPDTGRWKLAVAASLCTFSYDDTQPDGPSNWATVCDSPLCSSGTTQSPLNLDSSTATAATGSPLRGAYSYDEATAVTIKNKGHTVEVSFPGNHSSLSGAAAKVADKSFQLLQYHVHTPSENRINGVSYPLEIHFVHRSEDATTLAVIGVVFTEGPASAFLTEFVEKLAAIPTKNAVDTLKEIKVQSVLDELEDLSYFSFAGSLTTPPCTEGVRWSVMRHPATASAEQIEKIHSLIHVSARPLQKLNARPIVYHAEESKASKLSSALGNREDEVTRYKIIGAVFVGVTGLVLVGALTAVFVRTRCCRRNCCSRKEADVRQPDDERRGGSSDATSAASGATSTDTDTTCTDVSEE